MPCGSSLRSRCFCLISPCPGAAVGEPAGEAAALGSGTTGRGRLQALSSGDFILVVSFCVFGSWFVFCFSRSPCGVWKHRRGGMRACVGVRCESTSGSPGACWRTAPGIPRRGRGGRGGFAWSCPRGAELGAASSTHGKAISSALLWRGPEQDKRIPAQRGAGLRGG